jgi:SAM-dependent methyltransferase
MPVYDALQNLLGGPLRVLDLGCAQGYFSFNLAAHGAAVHGVDISEENIALCNAIAQENTDITITFESGQLEDILAKLKEDQFDLILGLSVFHHIVHRRGAYFVRQLLRKLSSKAGICIFEFALPSEPVYWALCQPEDPRDLIQDFAFSHELACHATHLSEIMRPMYVASNSFWFIDGFAGRIQSWKVFPHALAIKANQDRRYYFDDGKFIKIYKIGNTSTQINRGVLNCEEIVREAEFLRHPPQGFPVPRLIAAGNNDHEAWLVRELIPGELLLDIIQRNQLYDPTQILNDVLDQCTKLEEAGYYHNDIRTWNVLILSDGHATLMDHGAIVKLPQDCVWPENIFLSFFIFIYEATAGCELDPTPMRIPAMSPGWFERPYCDFIQAFLSQPASMWSFELMRKLFDELVVQSKGKRLQKFDLNYLTIWQLAVERAIAFHTINNRDMTKKLEQIESSSRAQMEVERQHSQRLESELQSVYASRCWQITAPLRSASDCLLSAKTTMRRFPQIVWHSIEEVLSPQQDRAIRFIGAHSALKSRAQALIRRYPHTDSCSHSSSFATERMSERPIQASHEAIPVQLAKVSLLSGFHSPESWSGTQTRWMQGDAALKIVSPERRSAILSLKALAFDRSRTIEVHAGNEFAGSLEIPTNSFIDMTMPVMLAEGTNIIRLHVPEGCERPCDRPELNNPDSRCLSVAVQDVTVS